MMRVGVLAMEWPRLGRHSGGVGRYILRLVEALREDVQFTVYCLDTPELIDGVQFRTLPSDGQFSRYYGVPLAVRPLIRAAEHDVVHAHGDDWALLGARVPVLRTVYGLSYWEARTSHGLRRWNHWLQAGLEEVAVRTADLAVAIGLDSSEHFRIPILPPAITKREVAFSTDHPRKEARAVFVGTFDGRKQGWLALRAAERLRQAGFAFTVFGPDADRARYPAWVDFTSEASDNEVWETLRLAKVLLAPSTYEGFGIPMWEAMANGCYVVALPTPGSRFLLQDSGVGTEGTTPEAFLLAVDKYLTLDSAQVHSLAVVAALRAKEVLAQSSPSRYLDLYRRLAESGSRARQQ